MFFLQKLVKQQFIQKQSYHHPLECLAGHRFPKFQRSFRLTQFPTSQLGLILKVGLILKSSSKITLGLIIGETRATPSPSDFRLEANCKCQQSWTIKYSVNISMSNVEEKISSRMISTISYQTIGSRRQSLKPFSSSPSILRLFLCFLLFFFSSSSSRSIPSSTAFKRNHKRVKVTS